MADLILNWVGEKTSNVGTGPFILNGSVGGGYSTFAAAVASGELSDGDRVYYSYLEGDLAETGLGTYDAAASEISRETIYTAIDGDSRISTNATPVECMGAGRLVVSNLREAYGNLTSIDQELSTTSSPTFVGLTLTEGLTRQGSGPGFRQYNNDGERAHYFGTSSGAGLGVISKADGSEFFRADALGEYVDVAGNLITDSLVVSQNGGGLQVGVEAGRVFMAPWDADAYQFGNEFGYDPTEDEWYFETGLRVDGTISLKNDTDLLALDTDGVERTIARLDYNNYLNIGVSIGDTIIRGSGWSEIARFMGSGNFRAEGSITSHLSMQAKGGVNNVGGKVTFMDVSGTGAHRIGAYDWDASTWEELNINAGAIKVDPEGDSVFARKVGIGGPVAPGVGLLNLTTPYGNMVLFDRTEVAEIDTVFGVWVATEGAPQTDYAAFGPNTDALRVYGSGYVRAAGNFGVQGVASFNNQIRAQATLGTIGGSDLTKAALLVGSTGNGLGFDNNEIRQKGGNLHIGTIDAYSMYLGTNGATALSIDEGHNFDFRENDLSNIDTLNAANIASSGDMSANGVFRAYNGAKISVQGMNNGGPGHGIRWYDYANTSWVSYMATAHAGGSPSGSASLPSLDGRSGWHIRHRMGTGYFNGIIWERPDAVVMSLTADTGNLFTSGAMSPGSGTTRPDPTTLRPGAIWFDENTGELIRVNGAGDGWDTLLVGSNETANHNHTIAQVTGLQDSLNTLQGNIDAVTGNQSITALPNTSVQRNASGDTYARYARCSFVHMSHSAGERTDDHFFYSSYDGYIRKNTPEGFLASLKLDEVDNTSDEDKPVSGATQEALDTLEETVVAETQKSFNNIRINTLIGKNILPV